MWVKTIRARRRIWYELLGIAGGSTMINNWTYMILLAVISFLLFIRKKLLPEDKKLMSIFVCICLMIYSGFRYQVGTDYDGYAEMFDMIKLFGRYYNIEWGYYGLVKLCHAINANAQLVFLLFSVVTVYFVYRYIEYFSKDPELSWFLFVCIGPYYLNTFNGMRQWLAIAVFAYSLRYVQEKKGWHYMLLNCITSLFHFSSLLLLPLYFVLRTRRFNMKKILLCYAGLQLLNILGVVRLLADLLHASSYLQGDAAFELDQTYYLFFAMSIVCWGFSILRQNETITAELNIGRKDSTSEYKAWYKKVMSLPGNNIFESINLLSCLTVFLAITSTGISNMVFTRFNQYFFVGYLILVPQLLSTFKKSRTLLTIGVYLLSLLYYLMITSTASDLTPYRMNFNLFS
jgi:hypothetical protein